MNFRMDRLTFSFSCISYSLAREKKPEFFIIRLNIIWPACSYVAKSLIFETYYVKLLSNGIIIRILMLINMLR